MEPSAQVSGAPKKVEHVSPSQITTFRRCQREWGFKYIEGKETPDTPGTLLGKKVHKVLELWLRDGKPPDLNTEEGEIAKVGLQHYPAPKTRDMKVEHEMHFVFDGIEYFGFIDLHYLQTKTQLVVTDHKSTVSFDYMKTEEQLLTDPQSVLYSAWGTIAYRIDTVKAKWVYLRTRPKYISAPVEITWTLEQIWDAMGPVHETAKQIVAARRKKVMELPPSLDACGMFRGCPHRDYCVRKMSAVDRMKASLRQNEREQLVKKLKHEPPSLKPAVRQSAKLIVLPQSHTATTTPEEKPNMSLLNNLRTQAGVAPKAEAAATTSPKAAAAGRPALGGRAAAPATAAAGGRPALGRPAAAASTTTGASGRPPLARAAAPAATTRAATAPAAAGGRPALGRAAAAKPPEPEPANEPEVSENLEPPTEPEPELETAPEPTQRRARGANKPKNEDLNPHRVLADFHMAAIRAGAEPEIAEQHYNAWHNTVNGHA